MHLNFPRYLFLLSPQDQRPISRPSHTNHSHNNNYSRSDILSPHTRQPKHTHPHFRYSHNKYFTNDMALFLLKQCHYSRKKKNCSHIRPLFLRGFLALLLYSWVHYDCMSGLPLWTTTLRGMIRLLTASPASHAYSPLIAGFHSCWLWSSELPNFLRKIDIKCFTCTCP